MDYCHCGSLRDIMDSLNLTLSESEISYVCNSALKGLSYLHTRHIIHRDVKAANILIDKDGIVKLADFGVSESITSTWVSNSIAGTPLWMAPEVCKRQQFSYNVIFS